MKRELVERLERVARTLERVADCYAKVMARDAAKPKRSATAKQTRAARSR